MVLERTLESLLDSKEIKPVNPKGNQSWIFTGRTDAEAPILWPLEEKGPAYWKRPWCWQRLRAGVEGDDRGWDGWMASLTQWTWVSKLKKTVQDRDACHAVVNGVTKVRNDLVTEQQQHIFSPCAQTILSLSILPAMRGKGSMSMVGRIMTPHMSIP